VSDLQQTFEDLIGQIIGSSIVQIGWRLVLAYLVIIWLATAYWTFRDLHQRTRNPLAPYLAAGGVLALTPFGFPLALIAYRAVRPPETVVERRARDLEAYVLASEVGRSSCAGCRRAVDEMWMRCPACGLQLATSCHSCGGRVERDWTVCAWCARDLVPSGSPAVEIPPPLPVPGVLTPSDDGVAAARGAIEGWDPTIRLPGVAGQEPTSIEEPAPHWASAEERVESSEASRERDDRRRLRTATQVEPQTSSPRR
jgi:hypothetical protein